MERLTTRHNGYPAMAQGYEERFTESSLFFMLLNRLAAYEDTGLGPEDVISLCSMSERAKMADLLRLEEYQSIGSIVHLQELAQAEKDGRLVMLQDGITVHDLQNKYCNARRIADERLPSPDYTTGRIAGFGEGVIHVLDKILTREEAEAALKKREADNEAD